METIKNTELGRSVKVMTTHFRLQGSARHFAGAEQCTSGRNSQCHETLRTPAAIRALGRERHANRAGLLAAQAVASWRWAGGRWCFRRYAFRAEGGRLETSRR